MKKRIGLLGGNFNPVHNAHLFIADQVRQKMDLDEVLFMPEYKPPHVDKKETISAHHRLKMLELALENRPGLGIEDFEIERGGVSYTYETMKELTRINPQIEYYFIIGEDMVDYLPKWHKIDELLELIQFIAVRRSDKERGEEKYPVEWIDLPYMDISSTYIRNEFKEGLEPNFILPQKVLEYIKDKEIYR